MEDSSKNLPANFSWSDLKCVITAFQNYFPSAVKNRDVQKEIINKFLDFYLGGKIRRGLSVCDLIFAAISIMPLTLGQEAFIWPDTEYKDDGTIFFLSPEDMLNYDYQTIKQKYQDLSTNESTKVNGNSKVDQAEPNEPVQREKNPQENTNPEKCAEIENKNQGNVVETKDNDKIASQEIKNESYNQVMADKSILQNESKKSDLDEENKEHEILEQSKEENQFPSEVKWLITRSYKENKQLNYGPVENAAFTKYCNKLLDSWDTNEEARILLKSLFGFVALTLMRATAKSPKHLMNTFKSERFRNTLREFFGWNHTFSVPHKKCIKNSHRIISKRGGFIPILLAKIVFWSLNRKATSNEIRCKIFKTAVLTHTSNYGFGMVNMLQTINKHYKNMNSVYNITFCDDTKASWDILNAFIRKYMIESVEQFTYPWARIIDNEEFKILNCQNNLALAVILAEIIDNLDTNPGLWDSNWVKNADKEKVNHYKTLGQCLYTKLKCQAEEDAKKLMDLNILLKQFNFNNCVADEIYEENAFNNCVADELSYEENDFDNCVADQLSYEENDFNSCVADELSYEENDFNNCVADDICNDDLFAMLFDF